MSSIMNFLPFNNNPTKSKYLGLLIFFGKSNVVAFQDILDKF